MLSDVAKFIKKEYRALTKSSLSLQEDGDVQVLVQPVSRVRTLVTAKRSYVIGGVDLLEAERPELDMPNTPESTKKSQNDKRKSDPFEVFKAYNFSNRKK